MLEEQSWAKNRYFVTRYRCFLLITRYRYSCFGKYEKQLGFVIFLSE
jgi:hypothetical protein